MCVRTLSQIAVFTVMSVKTSAGTWTVYQQPHPWRKLTPWQPSVVSSSSVRSGASEASSPFLLEFRWLRFMQVIIANHSIIWLLRVPKPVFHIPLSYGSYNLSSFFFFFFCSVPELWGLGVDTDIPCIVEYPMITYFLTSYDSALTTAQSSSNLWI